MRILIAIVLTLLALTANAKMETYDILTFDLPKGWNKEYGQNSLAVSTVDKKTRAWCKLGLYKSVDSAGSAEADFARDWKLLVRDPLQARDERPSTQVTSTDGWTVSTAGSAFAFDGAEAAVLLTNLTGHGKTVSVVAMTNSDNFVPVIENIMKSLRLTRPAAVTAPPPGSTGPAAPAHVDGYAFTTTNFDDGWVATVQPDWVEARKGDIRALLHYPKEGTILPGNPDQVINNAWDKLVAPRYANLRDYRIAPTLTETPRGYLSSGSLTDRQTGREVYVVLFRRDGGWIEIVAPSRQAFTQSFGLDPHTIHHNQYSDIWAPLEKLYGYNKFAVAASDLKGKWTNNFTGMQDYYNVYTGYSVGTRVNSSSQTFDFLSGRNYQWEMVYVQGFVGSMNVSQPKSRGKFDLPNNWQIEFSDIEGKPGLYDAFFTAIKGGRVLKMNDAKFPGSGVFTAFGRSK